MKAGAEMGIKSGKCYWGKQRYRQKEPDFREGKNGGTVSREGAGAGNEAGKTAASLTVEAALLMPVVLTVLLFFLYFIQVLYVEQELYSAAVKTLRETSACGYLMKYADSGQTALKNAKGEYFEAADFACEILQGAGYYVWFQSAVKSRVTDKKSIDNAVKGGFAGISFWGSDAYAEDELTVVCMKYKIVFPVFGKLIPPVSFQKNIFMRSFSGEGVLEKAEDEEEGSEEGYVYVTETGTVYHVNVNCTYIKLSLESKGIGELNSLRNKYGGKYYPCDACVKKGESMETIWITGSGTHYHSRKNCSKIKRNVKKITVSEAEKYRPCSRCAAKEGT